MKITFAFIALAISLSTQQHFPYKYYGGSVYRTPQYLPWGYYNNLMSPNRYHYDEDIMGRQVFKRPETPHFAVLDNWNTVVQIPSGKQNDNDGDWMDVQSRGKLVPKRVELQAQYDDNPLEGRFYFNQVQNANTNNPFLKTVYYFTSATATTCVVSSCIPAAQFANASAQNNLCRRKRREIIHDIFDSLDNGEETIMITELTTPTTVLKVLPTTKPTGGFVNEIASLPDSIKRQVQLMSSKSEDHLGEATLPQVTTSSRTKRFLRNLFAVSSTVTIYTFVTTTFTSTIIQAADAALICRPANVAVCAA